MLCRDPWQQVAPLIDASTPLCDGSSPLLDAGIDAGTGSGNPRLDGGGMLVDASDAGHEPTADRARSAGGCTVAILTGASTWDWLVSALLLAGWVRRVRARSRRGG
jgi:hypothetical protein